MKLVCFREYGTLRSVHLFAILTYMLELPLYSKRKKVTCMYQCPCHTYWHYYANKCLRTYWHYANKCLRLILCISQTQQLTCPICIDDIWWLSVCRVCKTKTHILFLTARCDCCLLHQPCTVLVMHTIYWHSWTSVHQLFYSNYTSINLTRMVGLTSLLHDTKQIFNAV